MAYRVAMVLSTRQRAASVPSNVDRPRVATPPVPPRYSHRPHPHTQYNHTRSAMPCPPPQRPSRRIPVVQRPGIQPTGTERSDQPPYYTVVSQPSTKTGQRTTPPRILLHASRYGRRSDGVCVQVHKRACMPKRERRSCADSGASRTEGKVTLGLEEGGTSVKD